MFLNLREIYHNVNKSSFFKVVEEKVNSSVHQFDFIQETSKWVLIQRGLKTYNEGIHVEQSMKFL